MFHICILMHAADGVREPLPSSIGGKGPLTQMGIPGQAPADPEDTFVTAAPTGLAGEPRQCHIAVVLTTAESHCRGSLCVTWPDSMVPVRAVVPVRVERGNG